MEHRPDGQGPKHTDNVVVLRPRKATLVDVCEHAPQVMQTVERGLTSSIATALKV